MNPELDLRFALALIIVQRFISARFQELTGMTLDEWDERNYQRMLSTDDCPC